MAIFEISNIQLDSEALRTKAIETRWNECRNICISSTFLCLCPQNLSFKENFTYIEKGLLNGVCIDLYALKASWPDILLAPWEICCVPL